MSGGEKNEVEGFNCLFSMTSPYVDHSNLFFFLHHGFSMCQGRLAYFPLGPEPQLLWHGQKHMRNASERPFGGVAVFHFLVYSNLNQ